MDDEPAVIAALRREAVAAGMELRVFRHSHPAEDALLWSLTTERFDDGTAGEGIAAVRRVMDSAFGTVEVAEGARITLTSDTGTVPVTLQRTSGGAVEVLVEMDSAGRLLWDDEARSQLVTLPANGSRTVSFSTRAVSRGTFPVTVSVYDPTRTRRLDAATISVRSTTISRTALIAIGTVVVGLLLAALYHPVWTAGVLDGRDFALAAAAFLLLFMWKTPPWLVVLLCALGGAAIGVL